MSPSFFLLSLSSCPITYGVWSCGSGGRGPGPMDTYWCLHRGVVCCGGVRAVVAMSGLRICICCVVSWHWAGRDQIATNDVTQALFVEGGESGGSLLLCVRMGTLHMVHPESSGWDPPWSLSLVVVVLSALLPGCPCCLPLLTGSRFLVQLKC